MEWWAYSQHLAGLLLLEHYIVVHHPVSPALQDPCQLLISPQPQQTVLQYTS